MTAEHLKNWIKTQTDYGDGISVGCIDSTKQRWIGVYDGRASAQRICIGGKDQTKYAEYNATVLVHWTTNPVDASDKAREVYGLFYGLSGADMDGVRIVSVDPGGQAEWAGRDDRRVCEYVINLKILYEREDE